MPPRELTNFWTNLSNPGICGGLASHAGVLGELVFHSWGLEQEFRRFLSGRRPSPMLDEDAGQDVASNAQERNTSVIVVTRLWRLAVALPERNYRRRRERLFCGMWSLTFRAHPRGTVGPRNTTINEISAQTKGFCILTSTWIIFELRVLLSLLIFPFIKIGNIDNQAPAGISPGGLHKSEVSWHIRRRKAFDQILSPIINAAEVNYSSFMVFRTRFEW